jgi:thioredoxin 1
VQIHRIRIERLGRETNLSNAAEITAQDFDKEVLESEIPVLVDFWAEWCGPCKMIAPAVDAIAGEYAGKLKVLKLDIDKEASVAAKYGVMSIPTLIVFKKGQVAEQIVGAMPKQKIEEKITPHLS